MRLVIFSLLLVLCISQCFGQKTVLDYKKKADSFLLKKYGNTVTTRLNCKELLYGNSKNPDDFEYDELKKVIKKDLKATYYKFVYTLTSKEIDDDFTFWVTVAKTYAVVDSFSSFKDIPGCIIEDKNCKFIKSDSAIKIALKDNIMYPKNLSTSFFKSKKNGNYYWMVQGSDPDPKGDGSNTVIANSDQFRRIDALTGEIVPGLYE